MYRYIVPFEMAVFTTHHLLDSLSYFSFETPEQLKATLDFKLLDLNI